MQKNRFLILIILMGFKFSLDASSKNVTKDAIDKALPVVFLCSECACSIAGGCFNVNSHMRSVHGENVSSSYHCDCNGFEGTKKKDMITHLMKKHKSDIKGCFCNDEDIEVIRMIVRFQGYEKILRRPSAKKENKLEELSSDKQTRSSLRDAKRVRIESECDDLENRVFGDMAAKTVASALLALRAGAELPIT